MWILLAMMKMVPQILSGPENAWLGILFIFYYLMTFFSSKKYKFIFPQTVDKSAGWSRFSTWMSNSLCMCISHEWTFVVWQNWMVRLGLVFLCPLAWMERVSPPRWLSEGCGVYENEPGVYWCPGGCCLVYITTLVFESCFHVCNLFTFIGFIAS